MRPNHLLSVTVSALLLTTAAIAQADVVEKSSDAQISERVKAQLIEKDRDVARYIAVTTQDGVVTLSGNALSPQYAANALRDAGQVDGVVKVKNHLKVLD
jgi:osmotically-inducible protein OsmY